MSFDIELAMAKLDDLTAGEREAIFTSANFLVSSVLPSLYAFSALKVRNLRLHIDEHPVVQSDLGEYIRPYKPVVTVTFECDCESFHGTMFIPKAKLKPKPNPKITKILTPEEEEKELENMLASLTVKRVGRGDLIRDF